MSNTSYETNYMPKRHKSMIITIYRVSICPQKIIYCRIIYFFQIFNIHITHCIKYFIKGRTTISDNTPSFIFFQILPANKFRYTKTLFISITQLLHLPLIFLCIFLYFMFLSRTSYLCFFLNQSSF